MDLDVKITAYLTPILEASVVITRGNSKSHIELDIVAAHSGDQRVLELLRSQARNVLKKRGEGLCPDASVSPAPGVHLITGWCKKTNCLLNLWRTGSLLPRVGDLAKRSCRPTIIRPGLAPSR